MNKLLILLLFLPIVAFSKTIFHIDDIEVEGITRFSREALLSNLPLNQDRALDIENSEQVIKRLYKSNFYKDIQLFVNNEKLIIKVKERPSIDKITFKGNKKLDDKQLKEILDGANIKKGRTFNRSILSRIETELRKFYIGYGKYGVQIKSELIQLKRNRIAIKVKVSEGQIAKIQQINIVGNTIYSDKKLKNLMELGIVASINPFSSADEYSKAKLSGDLETIKSYYLDRGYLRFAVKSSQISLSPDKERVFITIHLFEGPKYKVSSVDLKGEFKVAKHELEKKILLKNNTFFSRKLMVATTQGIKDRLGDSGYAFAKVTALPEVNNKEKTVKLTYLIEPQKKVYVRRINIRGNTKTIDEVFRREYRQLEGAWLSPRLLKRSKTRIQRLSYVSQATNKIVKVPGTTDQVDIETTVTERPSGSFTIGGGFSNSEGLLFNMSFAQQNWLGTGKGLSISFDNSQINKRLALSVTNPYFTEDGVSRTLKLYFKEVDATEIETTADYLANNTGASITYGIPRSEIETISLSIGIDQTRISETSSTPVDITSFLSQKGTEFNEIKLSGSYIIDTRDRTVFATSGAKNSFELEFSTPGSTLEYFKSSYQLEYNYPITDLTTMVFRTKLAYGHSYSKDEPLAFFKRYFAGGIYSVRGYQVFGIGPKDSVGNALGGDLLTTGSLEVVFPPAEEDLTSSMRYSLFTDFGTVSETSGSYNVSNIRYSVGAALAWLSPIGPLNFSLSEAINPDESDATESFQFYIGGIF